MRRLKGTRTKKSVNGIEHLYVMENGNLKTEEIGSGESKQINLYFYNQNGLFGAQINGTVYYYVKNLLGDIIEIRRASDNSLVASYVYDAWGNHIVCNADGSENTDPNFIGNLNPFRYRGYYFDTDVKMYYLQTRWYDPEIGRFVNMDQIEYLDPETANGLNLYAYCGNNPVMGYDSEGTFWGILIGFIAIFSVIAGLSGDSPKEYEPKIKEKDLNINGNNPNGSINVTIYDNNIFIEDSYEIKDRQRMREILSYVMAHEDYTKYGYYRSMDSYIEEWEAHNFVYQLGIGKVLMLFRPEKIDPTQSVNLDLDPDKLSDFYCLPSFISYYLLWGYLR